MAYNVQLAFMVHWQPGEFMPPEDITEEKRAEARRWLKRNRDAAHMTLSVLAYYAQVSPVDPDYAMCWLKMEQIAAHIQKSVREARRIMRQLEALGDVVTSPCDGSCAARGTRPNHNHYWLQRPSVAAPWAIPDTAPKKERSQPDARKA